MKFHRTILITAVLLVTVCGGLLLMTSHQTEQTIVGFEARVSQIAASERPPALDIARIETLPVPVRRYFEFVFTDSVAPNSAVRMTSEAQFRRPLTESFYPMQARQVIAVAQPALMFSGTTSVLPGIWARAYDYFAQGKMEMKAKVLSAITVVDEHETPELNRISLRRWLLESALYPQALLPGGLVTWKSIDNNSALATVSSNGMSASLIAHFDESGQMTSMEATEPGDLSTPYHGSGEHVSRSDFRLVDGQMIPHRFIISRSADGRLYPFYDGQITSIEFEQELSGAAQ